MNEQVTITPEQMAEYQRQQAAIEQKAMQELGEALVAMAADHGYVIEARAVPVEDGRPGVISISAGWGLRKKVG